MQEAFVNINSIPTHIISWAPWIEESFPKKEVVICITGNPGLPGFYTKFSKTIHEHIDPDIPVWVIGHAGHDEPPETSLRRVPPLRGNEDKYNLDAQIKHKLEFIETYVPDDVKIHLIGHSIGAWMIIEMLKREPAIRDKIQHSYLLFPTIERMAVSPNGFYFTKLFQRIWFLLRFIVIIFSKFPVFFQVFLLSIYFWLASIPRQFLGTGLKYSRLTIMEKVLFLANEEMKRVVELDSATLETLRNNHRILKFYYGASDGWTPLKYCHQLKEKIPELDLEIDTRKFDHAFVIKSSEEVGKMVADWIMHRRRY
ncbi:hypothetical protein HA402_005977 [Bradysia odoriphaga]|nr:hypothetical protein HA402_005977 [Bradysia odoriphaga]